MEDALWENGEPKFAVLTTASYGIVRARVQLQSTGIPHPSGLRMAGVPGAPQTTRGPTAIARRNQHNAQTAPPSRDRSRPPHGAAAAPPWQPTLPPAPSPTTDRWEQQWHGSWTATGWNRDDWHQSNWSWSNSPPAAGGDARCQWCWVIHGDRPCPPLRPAPQTVPTAAPANSEPCPWCGALHEGGCPAVMPELGTPPVSPRLPALGTPPESPRLQVFATPPESPRLPAFATPPLAAARVAMAKKAPEQPVIAMNEELTGKYDIVMTDGASDSGASGLIDPGVHWASEFRAAFSKWTDQRDSEMESEASAEVLDVPTPAPTPPPQPFQAEQRYLQGGIAKCPPLYLAQRRPPVPWRPGAPASSGATPLPPPPPAPPRAVPPPSVVQVAREPVVDEFAGMVPPQPFCAFQVLVRAAVEPMAPALPDDVEEVPCALALVDGVDQWVRTYLPGLTEKNSRNIVRAFREARVVPLLDIAKLQQVKLSKRTYWRLKWAGERGWQKASSFETNRMAQMHRGGHATTSIGMMSILSQRRINRGDYQGIYGQLTMNVTDTPSLETVFDKVARSKKNWSGAICDCEVRGRFESLNGGGTEADNEAVAKGAIIHQTSGARWAWPQELNKFIGIWVPLTGNLLDDIYGGDSDDEDPW